MQKIKELVIDNKDLKFSWGVEPALNKALSLGVAEGLFALKGDKYTLTKAGADWFVIIEKDIDLFSIERNFLTEVGKRKVSEEYLKNLTKNLFL